MRNRFYNKIKANLGGYFWLPCPNCGQYFGGHEWLVDSEHQSSVPLGRGRGKGICPDCTMAGVGDRAWASGKVWRESN